MLSSRYLHLHEALGLGPMWFKRGAKVLPAAEPAPAAMPAPPAALMVPPLRPAPPEGGTVRQLLHHAATFGGYVQELENQNAAWREWVRAGMDAGLRRHDGEKE